MSNFRCAIYARYSSDKQSPMSIDDQVRKCREHAASQGWEVLEKHVYSDSAMSGTSSDDRPDLCALMEAASTPGRVFDVLLVDDTSRLARHQATAMQLFERFDFLGIRVVAVGQGIDSTSEQAGVLMTVHGLIDSQYVKELAKKTHRGLEGKVLRGFHAGGRCFGYRNMKTTDGVRLEVNEEEAATVRRIFEMSANGYSLKAITRALNAEQLPPPRARAGRQRPTWCPTAIREMLRRELYIGRVVWNRSKFVKKPGSRKRLRRERQQSEWRTIDLPELRILNDDLWRAVQDRLAWAADTYGRRRRGQKLIGRGVHHLLSGFLKCAECGSNLTIVVGAGKGRQARYGCPHNSLRGVCSNDLREREDWIAERLLSDLQANVLRPEVVDFAVEEFGRQLKARVSVLSGQLAVDRERKALLEEERDHLWDVAAKGCDFESLGPQIQKRDREIRQITDRLLSVGAGSLEAELVEIRRFVSKNLQDIRSLLNRDIPAARAELAKHVKEIRMCPKQVGAKRFYVADGEWNLLGGFKGSFLKEPPMLREIDGCGGWI